jgi:quinol monooxygenase YgiN
MILSIVRHPLRAKYADEWPVLSAEFTAATRAEPGNICFDWFRSVDDPNVYLLVEMFRDRAAGDLHVNSDHFKAAMGQMGHAYAGMPEVVNVEVPGEGWSAMAEVQRAVEGE